jgi:hypothetical protein
LVEAEYCAVLEFYSCLERLTALRKYTNDKWVRDARLIISALIEDGNPLIPK